MKSRSFVYSFLLLLFIVSIIACKKKTQEIQLLKKDCQEIIQSAQKWYSELDSKLSIQIGYSKFTFLEIGKPQETLSNQDLTFTNQNGSFTISERTPDQFTLTATGMEEKSLRYIIKRTEYVNEPETIQLN